jgi:2-keto-3-deoxy-L-rhamnonate aldolase RhmA
MKKIIEKLGAGQILSGISYFSAAPSLMDIVGEAGMDFAMIDTEHAPISVEQACALVRICTAAGVSPLIRLPSNAPGPILKALESGTEGIVISMVEKREDIALALEAALYPPKGRRGSCPSTRASGYALRDWNEHTARANADCLVIPLIESPKAIENLDEILAVDGVKVIYVGPADLSQAMGLPSASFEQPALRDILSGLVRAATSRGISVWTSTGARAPAGYVRMLVETGVRMLNFSSDEVIFANACRACMNSFKEGALRQPGN